MIDRLESLFPEIYKERKASISPFRLILAAVSVFCISALLYVSTFSVAGGSPDQQRSVNNYLGILSMINLMCITILGMITAIKAIETERSQKTWDFQRLTPLSSWRITLGKLLASFLYPTFISLCFLPAVLIGVAKSPSPYATESLVGFVVNYFSAFSMTALGLLISAYADKGGRMLTGLGFFIIFTRLPSMVSGRFWSESDSGMRLFGIDLSSSEWQLLCSALLTFWAILGTRWRLGEDLLEGRRFWRFPAFIGFVYIFFSAISQKASFVDDPVSNLGLLVLLIPFLGYLLSLSDPAPKVRMRKIFAKESSWMERLNELPLWAIVFISIAICSSLLYWTASAPAVEQRLKLLPSLVLAPLFLLRDQIIFQSLVWARIRMAPIFSIFISLLLYIFPSAFISILSSWKGGPDLEAILGIFIPLNSSGTLSLVSVAGILVQIAVAGFILYLIYKKKNLHVDSKES